MRTARLGLGLVLAAILGGTIMTGTDRGAFDFQSFYCAGAAVRAHADPYRSEPLGACEHAMTDKSYAALAPGVVLPAPLPGFDIAGFALLSLWPFSVAKVLWGAVLGITLALTLYGCTRVTRAPPLTVFLALAASLVMPSFAFGEMFAIYAAACALVLLFCREERWTFAGIAAAATLTEPHLGLPVCVALFIWERKTRVPIAGGVALLLAASTLAIGWRDNVEYVATILPLHAISELASDAQLSLAAVAYRLGVSASQALTIGTLAYIAAAAAAIRFGKILAQRFNDKAFIAAVPAAFALIGGTFIHATEFFAAVPLVLLLVYHARAYRWALTFALVLLAVPWFVTVQRGNAGATAALCALIVLALLWQQGVSISGVFAAIATFAILYAAPHLYANAVASAPAIVPSPIDPKFPQASWQIWNDRELATGSTIAWALRAASWTGLTLAAVLTGWLSRSTVSLLTAAG